MLTQAQELLRSEHAEIMLLRAGQRASVRIGLQPERPPASRREPQLVDRHDPVVAAPASTSCARCSCRAASRDHRGTRATWPPGDGARRSSSRCAATRGVVGTLTVADRLGDVRTFDVSDMRLLETVANHAGIALQNSRLIDQLRHESPARRA